MGMNPRGRPVNFVRTFMMGSHDCNPMFALGLHPLTTKQEFKIHPLRLSIIPSFSRWVFNRKKFMGMKQTLSNKHLHSLLLIIITITTITSHTITTHTNPSFTMSEGIMSEEEFQARVGELRSHYVHLVRCHEKLRNGQALSAYDLAGLVINTTATHTSTSTSPATVSATPTRTKSGIKIRLKSTRELRRMEAEEKRKRELEKMVPTGQEFAVVVEEGDGVKVIVEIGGEWEGKREEYVVGE
ncbi:hypothetical protein BJ508DRAFT_308652 [Ascobolus immersus RN42]|uniref:Uncharacterized protein n=1 Tax=Ascobolus immersus RN42 TaxID=1160509 RepID=A0A3N4HYW2_ASCIM|nr:hypothetical protein BJ508DRAFT_308652 [Ascobolus immersus RN42]